MCGEQLEQPGIRRLHFLHFLRARLAMVEVEVVDIHVVVVQRPACGLRFGEIGIAVCRMQPGAPDVERYAEMLAGCPGPAADAVHGLQHRKGKAGIPQRPGCGKACRAGADNNHVHVIHAYPPQARRCAKFAGRHKFYAIVGEFRPVSQTGAGGEAVTIPRFAGKVVSGT
jgi:hypothetical protein